MDEIVKFYFGWLHSLNFSHFILARPIVRNAEHDRGHHIGDSYYKGCGGEVWFLKGKLHLDWRMIKQIRMIVDLLQSPCKNESLCLLNVHSGRFNLQQLHRIKYKQKAQEQ